MASVSLERTEWKISERVLFVSYELYHLNLNRISNFVEFRLIRSNCIINSLMQITLLRQQTSATHFILFRIIFELSDTVPRIINSVQINSV